jgi:Zn-dependent peptidase ImmA (M78 family)
MPAVSPKILVWARESAGLDLATAAEKLALGTSKNGTPEQKLRDYEEGKREPSRSLILKMSKQYRRPLLVFYLKDPPRKGNRGEDYRTVSSIIDPAQNALIDALVRNVLARQQIMRDALISAQDRNPISFIGSYPISNGVSDLVARITHEIAFDRNVYRQTRTQEDAFKYLRECVERSGVFTLLAGNLGSHHTNISAEEFRGFAMADDIAPFIVVNDQDAKTAWSTTLLHELAHLWLGETGVSGLSIEQSVERFCNQVASETLLPEAELTSRFEFNANDGLDTIVQKIDSLASDCKVSSRLIAFRLLERKSIDSTTYSRLVDFFRDRFERSRAQNRAKAKESEGGPSYYLVKRHRLGTAVLNVSDRLLRAGELSTTRAATLLDVRALNVEKLLQSKRTA